MQITRKTKILFVGFDSPKYFAFRVYLSNRDVVGILITSESSFVGATLLIKILREKNHCHDVLTPWSQVEIAYGEYNLHLCTCMYWSLLLCTFRIVVKNKSL